MDIVILVFDGITALDAVGPYEVLSRLPGARVRFVAEAAGPVRTDNKMLGLIADAGIDEVEAADLLLIPGGWGTRALEKNEPVLDWVRRVHATTKHTTSVCTGAIVLAAAGILDGKQATTHWAQRERLSDYGAEPVAERWVRSGKIVSAAGVSAGIDMALQLVSELTSETVARAIQLGIEYDPAPPFEGGSLETSPPEIVALVRAALAKR